MGKEVDRVTQGGAADMAGVTVGDVLALAGPYRASRLSLPRLASAIAGLPAEPVPFQFLRPVVENATLDGDEEEEEELDEPIELEELDLVMDVSTKPASAPLGLRLEKSAPYGG
eukprot:CAMPEP_0118972454 /NCGR_PEP_ID=MMETSP1173-20130426/8755_1 /TAXON_ID=1034831 /ORGANISM="Rhizochromulina marina cf, Strain CCMP1243" /LENGTH=113 /DNA_ID=CAMNT_0006921995 /DNA_START=21 /DNA_END=358 /DNA_ORIENTATION=+